MRLTVLMKMQTWQHSAPAHPTRNDSLQPPQPAASLSARLPLLSCKTMPVACCLIGCSSLLAAHAPQPAAEPPACTALVSALARRAWPQVGHWLCLSHCSCCVHCCDGCACDVVVVVPLGPHQDTLAATMPDMLSLRMSITPLCWPHLQVVAAVFQHLACWHLRQTRSHLLGRAPTAAVLIAVAASPSRNSSSPQLLSCVLALGLGSPQTQQQTC